MLVKSEYKDKLSSICYDNKISVLFSEIELGGEYYLNITYGGTFLKPILKKMGIEYFD